MLRNRILTALVLAPVVIAGVLLAPNDVLAMAFAVVVLLGAREMGRLGGLQGLVPQWIYAGLVALLMVSAYLMLAPQVAYWLEFAAALFWILISLWLLARRRALSRVQAIRPGILLLGALQLAVVWLSAIKLHAAGPNGPSLLLFVLLLIWTADSAAYFAGRAFGRHKLSPSVSPGKTWEGAAGGILGACLAGLLLWYGVLHAFDPFGLVLLCVVTACVSIGGDLWESLLKRQAGLKDSGALLPGHGGVLDRVDSLIAAIPVFSLGLTFLGNGL